MRNIKNREDKAAKKVKYIKVKEDSCGQIFMRT